MGKIMALDVGEKTIGVAFCEEGTRIAFPGQTLLRHEGKKRDMAALRQLVADNQVSRIVVGMPLLPDGTFGIQAEKVEAFIATLRNYVRIPIIRQDERFSTEEAASLLIAVNRRPAEHKKTIDSVAAALILEWYLETERPPTCQRFDPGSDTGSDSRFDPGSDPGSDPGFERMLDA
jgi:putative Holliday junction resolvase